MENSPPRASYIEGKIWGNSPHTKLKEGMSNEINFAQFLREPSTAKSAPLHKGTIEYTLRISKRFASSPKSINDSAPRMSKPQERTLGRRRGLGAHRGTRLNRLWHRPENIKILLPVRGVEQQDFEGLLWGERIWGPRPISYQAQDPCRGGRNARRRTKGIQTARIYCRRRPCPWQTKITEGESATPPEAVPSSIPKEVSSPVG